MPLALSAFPCTSLLSSLLLICAVCCIARLPGHHIWWGPATAVAAISLALRAGLQGTFPRTFLFFLGHTADSVLACGGFSLSGFLWCAVGLSPRRRGSRSVLSGFVPLAFCRGLLSSYRSRQVREQGRFDRRVELPSACCCFVPLNPARGQGSQSVGHMLRVSNLHPIQLCAAAMMATGQVLSKHWSTFRCPHTYLVRMHACYLHMHVHVHVHG